MPATSTAVTTTETRLPRPKGMDASLWPVLCEVIFPGVQNSRSIILALQYCKARKLDILKRPVNIVPMWSSTLRREVDTIWPSINETQITAARSGEWAGMDAPVFGPDVQQTFSGTRKDKNGSYVDANVTVTFPTWCEITVYRLKQGQRYAFTERVYWLEAYGRSGGSTLPNATWVKRPIGQLAKVAKAAALRAAFPEDDSSPTDEEMRGGVIDDDMPEHASTPRQPIADAAAGAGADDGLEAGRDEPHAIVRADDQTWQDWGAKFMVAIRACSDGDIVDQWQQLNKTALDAMQAEMPKMHSNLAHAVNKHKLTLMPNEAVT